MYLRFTTNLYNTFYGRVKLGLMADITSNKHLENKKRKLFVTAELSQILIEHLSAH